MLRSDPKTYSIDMHEEELYILINWDCKGNLLSYKNLMLTGEGGRGVG